MDPDRHPGGLRPMSLPRETRMGESPDPRDPAHVIAQIRVLLELHHRCGPELTDGYLPSTPLDPAASSAIALTLADYLGTLPGVSPETAAEVSTTVRREHARRRQWDAFRELTVATAISW